MTIDEREMKFGARWDTWTSAQRVEHVAELTPQDVHNPANLKLALDNAGSLPEETATYLASLLR